MGILFVVWCVAGRRVGTCWCRFSGGVSYTMLYFSFCGGGGAMLYMISV